jgi:hypothetical protein
MQNGNKLNTINSFGYVLGYKRPEEIKSIEVDIPDPFCGDEEARKQYQESLKERWAKLDNHIGSDLDDWF